MENTASSMEKICKLMPKIELHAHLNGSISQEILYKITSQPMENQLVNNDESTWNPIPIKCLADAFVMFKKIHNVIRTTSILKQVTCDVIKSFAEDNVVYLELRTTPKAVHNISSKRDYLDAVIAGIIECKEKISSIIVKLLISVDRERSASDGKENAELAIEMAMKYPNIVVGVDLSGDPITGNIDWIIPVLKRVRDSGLQLACHLPEVINIEETNRLLEFDGIGRLGHGLYLHPSFGGAQNHWEIIRTKKIPIEACITSNIMTGVSESVEKHYVRLIHDEGIPYVICTDDAGVFNTTLSQEYIKFLQAVPISITELQGICIKSVTYSFASDAEKTYLSKLISKWWDNKKIDLDC